MDFRELAQYLTPEEIAVFEKLDTPYAIQQFLDQTPYSADERDRSPVAVLRDGVAHCLDGALFAAAALRRIGYPPVLVDMQPDPGMDDDHVLAIFRMNGRYGAVAKSNFTGLRFREAVYRSYRELVMSYFEAFFNMHGVKTLRFYTPPLRLATMDASGWMWSDEGAKRVEQRLAAMRLIPVIDRAMAEGLSPVDKITYDAGMMVVNWEGLYKPKT